MSADQQLLNLERNGPLPHVVLTHPGKQENLGACGSALTGSVMALTRWHPIRWLLGHFFHGWGALGEEALSLIYFCVPSKNSV